MRTKCAVVSVLIAAVGCGDSPITLLTDLPDGRYEIMTARPAVADQFSTPAWMYESPTIVFDKSGDSFVTVEGTDGFVVLGPAQFVFRASASWIVRFGWAPLEQHHYWQVEMTASRCAAAAVDADIGDGIVVPLRTCRIVRR